MQRGRIALLALVVGVLPAIAGLLPQPVLAATITVGIGDYTCDEAGLRQAIADAGNPGTVNFSCPAGTVINFTSEIVIPTGQSLTINGSNQIVFDGGWDPEIVGSGTRLFNVSIGGDLTLRRLVLRHGSSSSGEGHGGAIQSFGTATIEDVTFNENHAEIGGGAISNQSILIVTGSTFSGNVADQIGGAIQNGLSMRIMETTFSDNTAPSGGAIYNLGLPATIQRSIFSSNKASSQGGALTNISGRLTVTGSIFTGNTSQNNGGAAFNAYQMEISQSSFTSNQASYGGAIYNDVKSDSLMISQSSFTNNYANVNSGAIENVGTMTISQSSFKLNSADNYSGAIQSQGPLEIYQSSFTDNWAGEVGGAILNAGTLKISQSSFTDNQASYGGAIWHQDSTLDVNASTFSGNIAGANGSAILVASNAVQATIRWSTIVQPANTIPALHLDFPTTLEGVILAGAGNNCQFAPNGDTSDSYTLADDSSCQLDGAGSHVAELGLGPVATQTIAGVEQTYYPL